MSEAVPSQLDGMTRRPLLTPVDDDAGESGARRVATIAVMHGNHLLMGKRRDNEKWTTPGGHMDPGEAFSTGILRELEEETGIRLEPIRVQPLCDEPFEFTDKEGKPLLVMPYKAELAEKPATSMKEDPDAEVFRWRWVDVSNGLSDEIMESLHTPAERNCLLRLLGLTEYEDYEQDNNDDPDDAGNDEDSLKSLVTGFVSQLLSLALRRPVAKSQPGSSDVHVNAPLGSEEDKVKKEDMSPPLNNLEAMFIRAAGLHPEEDDEPVPKEVATAAARRGYVTPKDSEPIDTSGSKPKIESPDEADKEDVGKSGKGDNDLDGLYAMQQLVHGTDYELAFANQTISEDDARDIARANLDDDPLYYVKAADEEADEDDQRGLSVDLGSGQAREMGHLGFDLFPYDYGTLVHDLTLGIPLPDSAVQNVRMVNSLHYMDMADPKPLLSEIQRVLMPGGQFHYEGPNEIYNYPEWLEEVGKETVEKDEETPGWTKQTFTRVASPDAAAANDSEPRIGIAQYDMLPADALLAMDAMGYYWSDATSSGRGNRAHGYPSQGALVKKEAGPITFKGLVPIIKANKAKQIVYCVVLSPDEADLQDDIMMPEDIEKTAHEYMRKSRVIGSGHTHAIDAHPVESYIAPQDFEMNSGAYGPQVVKKGAWVLGIKINDPKEWAKVEDGSYQGVSVGGAGLRDAMN